MNQPVLRERGRAHPGGIHENSAPPMAVARMDSIVFSSCWYAQRNKEILADLG